MADNFIDDVDSVGSVMDQVEWIRVHGLDAPDLLADVAVSFLQLQMKLYSVSDCLQP